MFMSTAPGGWLTLFDGAARHGSCLTTLPSAALVYNVQSSTDSCSDALARHVMTIYTAAVEYKTETRQACPGHADHVINMICDPSPCHTLFWDASAGKRGAGLPGIGLNGLPLPQIHPAPGASGPTLCRVASDAFMHRFLQALRPGTMCPSTTFSGRVMCPFTNDTGSQLPGGYPCGVFRRQHGAFPSVTATTGVLAAEHLPLRLQPSSASITARLSSQGL